jgi:O-antigen ligase
MSARISKISLIVFVVLLVLSVFLLSVAGDYWPWYSVMAIFAVVPVLVGPNRYRIFGAIALLLSVYLIFGDIESGKHHRQQMQQIRDRLSSTNAP